MAERLQPEVLLQYVEQVVGETAAVMAAEKGMDGTQLKISRRDRAILIAVEGVFASASFMRTIELEAAITSYQERADYLLKAYQATKAKLEALQVAAGQTIPIVLPSGRTLIFGAQEETPKLIHPVADHQNEKTTLADQLKQSEQA